MRNNESVGTVDLDSPGTSVSLGRALPAALNQVLLRASDAVTAATIAALAGGHPDLLPSDVTGVSLFSHDRSTWPGPVFAHVVLVDHDGSISAATRVVETVLATTPSPRP